MKTLRQLILLSALTLVISPVAHADGMSQICQKIAENYISQQFQTEFNPPKVWVDYSNSASTNNYPEYNFEIRLSGETRNTWAHEVWQVQTSSMRGGCGVVRALMVNRSFDQ